MKTLNTKGQIFSTGSSLAYALIMFVISLFCIAILLSTTSDNLLAIHFHAIAIQYGADATVLGLFESMRKALPFVSLISLALGMFALSHSLSNVY